MKKSEVADLLTAIASTDNRTVGRLDIEMWFKILPEDLTLANAQDALIRLRLETNDWLTPKHIVDRVTEVRRERLQRAGTPPIPGDLTWKQEKAWRQLWCEAVKDGDADPETYANEALGIQPLAIEATSESVAEMRRQLIAALAEHKATPKPKPEDFKPKKARDRWGGWGRGDYITVNVMRPHVVFSPGGHSLFYGENLPGVPLYDFQTIDELESWMNIFRRKDWCEPQIMREFAAAFVSINECTDDQQSEIKGLLQHFGWYVPEVEDATLNRAHPTGGGV